MSTRVTDHAFVPCNCENPTNHSHPYCHQTDAKDEQHPLWRSVCGGYEEEHLPATNEHGECILTFGHLGLCVDSMNRQWDYAHQAPRVVAQSLPEAIRAAEHQGMDAQAQANLSRASIMLEQKQRELDLAIEAKEAAESDLLQTRLVSQSLARRIEHLEKDTRELQETKKALMEQINELNAELDSLDSRPPRPPVDHISANWTLHLVQSMIRRSLNECPCETCVEARREPR